jgi:hypothetical protein
MLLRCGGFVNMAPIQVGCGRRRDDPDLDKLYPSAGGRCRAYGFLDEAAFICGSLVEITGAQAVTWALRLRRRRPGDPSIAGRRT